MAVFGNLRKCWVLSAIFCTSLIYFVYNTTQFRRESNSNDGNSFQDANNFQKAERILRALKWHKPSKYQGNSTEIDEAFQTNHCRNSLQGKNMIADEEGYVCSRKDTRRTGCCDVAAESTNRYVCDTCRSSNCCSVYEHCVSCCLKPDKRPLLEKIIRETVNNLQQMVYANIRDQFGLCLSKCRTSSTSVQHENTYRDSKLKFCFGRNLPDLKIS